MSKASDGGTVSESSVDGNSVKLVPIMKTGRSTIDNASLAGRSTTQMTRRLSGARLVVVIVVVVCIAGLLAVLITLVVQGLKQRRLNSSSTAVEEYWLVKTRSPQWMERYACVIEPMRAASDLPVARAGNVGESGGTGGGSRYIKNSSPLAKDAVNTVLAAATLQTSLTSSFVSSSSQRSSSSLSLLSSEPRLSETATPLAAALQAQWDARVREALKSSKKGKGLFAAVHSSSQAQADYAFPVDFVATFVDPWDEHWRAAAAAEYKRLRSAPDIDKHPVYHETAREPALTQFLTSERDELFYCVISAIRFCPWLRCIWLVAQSPQCPRWLPAAVHQFGGSLGPWQVDQPASTASTGGKPIVGGGPQQAASLPYAVIGNIPVIIVHHESIFDPSMTTRPTFNSCMIESQMANIPELAEHFVYSNDDMFMCRPLQRRQLFTDGGVPVLAMHDTRPTIMGMNSIWGTQLKLMLRLADALQLPACQTPDHVAAPLRKSVLQRVVTLTKPFIARFKAFRSPADFPVWYLALNAAPYVDARDTVSTRYYHTGSHFASDARPIPHMACVNHDFYGTSFDKMDRILQIPPATPLPTVGDNTTQHSRNGASNAVAMTSTQVARDARRVVSPASLRRIGAQPLPYAPTTVPIPAQPPLSSRSLGHDT